MPATVATNTTATAKQCGLCGHKDPIPPGVDPSQVRCINVDAMWHATFYELLIRCMTTKGTMESHIATVVANMAAIDETIQAVKDDAARIANAIGD